MEVINIFNTFRYQTFQNFSNLTKEQKIGIIVAGILFILVKEVVEKIIAKMLSLDPSYRKITLVTSIIGSLFYFILFVDDLHKKNEKAKTEAESLAVLSKKILRGAKLKENPEIKNYTIGPIYKVTVVNHTDKKIRSYHESAIMYTNDFPSLPSYHCQFILYSLENLPEIVCFERKLIGSDSSLKRCIQNNLPKVGIGGFEKIAENFPFFSEKIYQKRIFTQLLKGFKDKGSFFQKNEIPIDIITPIFLQYNKILKNEFKVEYKSLKSKTVIDEDLRPYLKFISLDDRFPITTLRQVS